MCVIAYVQYADLDAENGASSSACDRTSRYETFNIGSGDGAVKGAGGIGGSGLGLRDGGDVINIDD